MPPPGVNKTILICDDDADILNICAMVLGKKGYATETTRQCEDALAKIRSNVPDVVLLDLWLPLMGGEALFNIIKGDASMSHVPVVLFSANSELENIAARIGADGFLKKPFDIYELVQTIERFAGH